MDMEVILIDGLMIREKLFGLNGILKLNKELKILQVMKPMLIKALMPIFPKEICLKLFKKDKRYRGNIVYK